MRKDRISQFQISVCKSELHELEFALVFPPDTNDPIDTQEQLCDAFIKYHLAIKPNCPVVLFQLETLLNVGSPLYQGTCPTIYHLPPSCYDSIEGFIHEGVFCVSQSYLIHVIEAGKLNHSLFSLLEPTRQELGLNVLGILHEAS